MMSLPEELKYTKEHEWVKEDGNAVRVGITEHAQAQLGDVVFIELPEAGAQVISGDIFGTVESVKAVSDLYAPVSGEVVEVNEALEGTPELVNSDPYGAGWMLKIQIDNEAGGALLSSDAYQDFLDTSS